MGAIVERRDNLFSFLILVSGPDAQNVERTCGQSLGNLNRRKGLLDFVKRHTLPEGIEIKALFESGPSFGTRPSFSPFAPKAPY